MAHIEADDRALIALGEPTTAQQGAHLRDCGSCSADVAELTALVSLGRGANPQDLLVEPPAHVWQSIAAQVRDGVDGPVGGPTPQPETGTPPVAAPPAPVADLSAARRSRERRRHARFWPLAAAAAVGAIIGGGAVAMLGGQDPTEPQERFVAQAVLDPVSQQQQAIHGTATASQGANGLEIRVDARELPPGDGFYEVWLLDSRATKLVALGALPAGSVGSFTVPPGVSLADFPVVDISLEPYDGDPGHSHNSLLRGSLQV